MVLIVDVAYHGEIGTIRAAAAAAEAHGAGGFYVSEACHDPFVGLAAAATSTDRLALGTSVAIAFARTPMSLAYAAYDLQALSGGRLILGLGTQVAAHITRRYGMPWSRPAARMREYVAALKTIWNSWQTGERLDFRGDFYTHTLMPPPFSAGPLGCSAPRVLLAAVGPRMLRVAAEVADGLILHPLTSISYRDEVVLPSVASIRAQLAPDPPFELSAMVLVATGGTEEELARAIQLTRMQLAFYSSTPAYAPVLEHHGWGDLHREAHACVARGDYLALSSLVDDEVLSTFAVLGGPAEVAEQLHTRFAGVVDRVTLTLPLPSGEDTGAILDAMSRRTEEGTQ